MRKHAWLEVDPSLNDVLEKVIGEITAHPVMLKASLIRYCPFVVSYILIERSRKRKIPIRLKLAHS